MDYWRINKNKELKLPEIYISYQNCEGSSSIRFTNYKAASLDDAESLMSESDFSGNRWKDLTECT
jgi:hypothetical protein